MANIKKHTKYTVQPMSQNFLSSLEFEVHFKLIHLGGDLFPCNHCSKAFSHNEYLKRHLENTLRQKPVFLPSVSKGFLRD